MNFGLFKNGAVISPEVTGQAPSPIAIGGQPSYAQTKVVTYKNAKDYAKGLNNEAKHGWRPVSVLNQHQNPSMAARAAGGLLFARGHDIIVVTYGK